MTITLAAPTVGGTPRSGAGVSWQPSSAPTGLSGVAGIDCAAAPHGTAVAGAPVAVAVSVDLAALPFVTPMFGAAATSTKATTVAAVAGNQQVATAPKQAKKFNATTSTLVNYMRENATSRGNRAEAPPS